MGRGPPLTLFQDYVLPFLIFLPDSIETQQPANSGLDSIFGTSWNDL